MILLGGILIIVICHILGFNLGNDKYCYRKTVDMVTKEYHPYARIAKDILQGCTYSLCKRINSWVFVIL